VFNIEQFYEMLLCKYPEQTQRTGGEWRIASNSVGLLCRWAHDRQIDPISLMSVSFDISFSRTASEPAMTGPAHTSQGYAQR